jgi:hypothetical protein
MKAIFIRFIGYEVSWASLRIINREARFINLRKLSQLTSCPLKLIKITFIFSSPELKAEFMLICISGMTKQYWTFLLTNCGGKFLGELWVHRQTSIFQFTKSKYVTIGIRVRVIIGASFASRRASPAISQYDSDERCGPWASCL